jgi:hypothetical protein
MQKIAYKISALLLCGLLIYNSLGYFLVLSVMRVAIQQKKRAQLINLTDEVLTYFVFAKNKTNERLKIVDDHEILVDGKLYDIVRTTEDERQVKYFCSYDHEEEALIAKTRLFNTKSQQMPLQDTTKLIVEKIIKSGVVSHELLPVSEGSKPEFSNYFKIFYSGPTIQISLPPPQSQC